MGPIESAINEKLQAALQPTHLAVTNDSEGHRGHAGYTDGESHFAVVIVSDNFSGKNRVARQRLVFAALGDMMKADIHALAIRALTPDEWQG